MTSVVRVGDIRRNEGLDMYVMAVERGRRGESRTVYVMGRMRENGEIRGMETRGHSVRSWPLIRRTTLRVTRDSFGCHTGIPMELPLRG